MTQHHNSVLKILVGLVFSLLFFLNCGESPIPGAITPTQVARENISGAEKNNRQVVTPIRRTAAGIKSKESSTAASGYVVARRALVYLAVELQYIVDHSPNAELVAGMATAYQRVGSAWLKLKNDPPEPDIALQKMANAQNQINGAIAAGHLNPVKGGQFLEELDFIIDYVEDGATQNITCDGTSKSLWMLREEGGLIYHCDHSIEVPANALPQDSDMSITIDEDDIVSVDFGPDTWFDQPVKVTISYKQANLGGVDPANLTMAWFDEATSQWIAVNNVQVDQSEENVTAWVNHFTQYALSFH